MTGACPAPRHLYGQVGALFGRYTAQEEEIVLFSLFVGKAVHVDPVVDDAAVGASSYRRHRAPRGVANRVVPTAMAVPDELGVRRDEAVHGGQHGNGHQMAHGHG
jgi:hypothetical protein